jgi:hypothetical protein
MKRTTKSFALPPGISRASLEQLEGPVGGLQQRWPLQPKRVAFPMRSARLFHFCIQENQNCVPLLGLRFQLGPESWWRCKEKRWNSVSGLQLEL